MHSSARNSFIRGFTTFSSRERGFTLVELLVVITIIAILSVIGVTVFTGIQKNARDTKKKGDVESIIKAYEVRYASTGSYGTTLIEGTAFASGSVPTPPEGGSYDVMLDNSTGGIKVCSTLADGSAFCQGSIQEQAPTGTTNITYLSGGPGGGGTPGPSSSPTPAPTSTPAPTATPTPLPELVVNGSFESSMTGWGCSSGGSTCVIDTANSRPGATGNKSMKVTHISATPPTGQSWGDDAYQAPPSNTIAAARGESFCLSGWVKRSNAADVGSLIIQDWQGTWKVSGVAMSAGIPWQFIRGTVTKGSDWTANTKLKIGLESNRVGGSIWFDDISLTRGACQ